MYNCKNTGDLNTGSMNTGNRNSGRFNTGHYNTGNRNIGHYNTGYRNSGDWNTGSRNTGHRNTGDYNSGEYNTGDWNTGNRNTGCFNTIEQTISLFNKPSTWTYRDWYFSEAKRMLDRIPKNSVWVKSDDMTDAEKKQHPTHETTGGYLKVLDEGDLAAERQRWWNSLTDDEREIIMSIPNFDKEIFKEITGIDVDATPPARDPKF